MNDRVAMVLLYPFSAELCTAQRTCRTDTDVGVHRPASTIRLTVRSADPMVLYSFAFFRPPHLPRPQYKAGAAGGSLLRLTVWIT